jgi:hypothetical protein
MKRQLRKRGCFFVTFWAGLVYACNETKKLFRFAFYVRLFFSFCASG